MSRQVKRKAQTRKLLVSAAREIFNEKGSDKTKIKHITDRADVAYGTFYNYFNSIDAIVKAVIQHTLQTHIDKTDEQISSIADPALAVATGFRTLFNFISSDPVSSWISKRPYILVEEFKNIVGPIAIEDMENGVKSGGFSLACSGDSWLTMVAWLFIGMLDKGPTAKKRKDREEEFLRICLRVLGVEDKELAVLLLKSTELAGLG